MAAARENVAYDLSLFEPKEEHKTREPVQKPKRKPATREAVKPGTVIRWVAVSLFVTLSLVSIMMCNVQLTNLSDHISKAQAQLSAAQGEEVRLNMQLESRTSLSNVESYAVNQLGMQKTNQYQVTYVHLADQDKVAVTPPSRNIFAWLGNLILEYL